MLQCTLLYAQVSQLEQAKKALEERKPHDAYAIFQTIVESDPDNIEAHNGMAKSLDYTGDPQGALMAYNNSCLLYTSPSPRDLSTSRMPSSA